MSTYFFDDRGFQFGHIYEYNPLGLVNSIAYSRSKNEFQSGFQYRLSEFLSDDREREYRDNKRLFESYMECYDYMSVLYFFKRTNHSLFQTYMLAGFTYRKGDEVIFTSGFYSDDIKLNDLALSLGWKIEVKLPKNLYLYFQPLYHIYFLRQKQFYHQYKLRIPQFEFNGFVGVGYKFNIRKSKNRNVCQ